jgi:hypothetical protein
MLSDKKGKKIKRKKDTAIASPFGDMKLEGAFAGMKSSGQERVQAKLEISSSGDVHEQQADEIARKVMSGSDAGMDVKAASNTVMAQCEDDGLHADDSLAGELGGTKGQGQMLSEDVRAEMESSMGTDLGDVRIHTGSKANEMSEGINAKAFTHGQDIYFKDGNFDPGSSQGKELLAHELVHTQQQGKGVGRKVQRSPLTETELYGIKFYLHEKPRYGTTIVNGAVMSEPHENATHLATGLFGLDEYDEETFIELLGVSEDGSWNYIKVISDGVIGFVKTDHITFSAGMLDTVEVVHKRTDAEKFAQRLHEAFKNTLGFKWYDLGKLQLMPMSPNATDESAVFRILNQGKDQLQEIERIYNERYHPEKDGSMVEDIYSELNDKEDEKATFLLMDAGIDLKQYKNEVDIPEIRLEKGKLSKSNPYADVLTTGQNIFYMLDEHHDEYEWYIVYETGTTMILDDQSASFAKGKKREKRFTNHFDVKWEDWKFPGTHKVVCRGKSKGKAPVYYTITQTVQGPEQQITTQDIKYELIAHDIVYRNYLDKQAKVPLPADSNNDYDDYKVQLKDYANSKTELSLLESWGYNSEVMIEKNDDDGFFCMLILPQPGRTDLHPILAFRGTDDFKKDVYADINMVGVGFGQYAVNKPGIQKLVLTGALHGKIDLTGHSLGGALCQWALTDPDFKGMFGKVILFQSPGISNSRVEQYKLWNDQDKAEQVTYHLAMGDPVDLAGEQNIPGARYFVHTTKKDANIVAHTHFLFTSDEYKSQREEAGIDENLLTKLGIDADSDKVAVERHMVKQYGGYPFTSKRAATEPARKTAGATVFIYEQTEKALKEAREELDRLQEKLKEKATEKLKEKIKELERMIRFYEAVIKMTPIIIL